MTKTRIILASTSPRRIELLSNAHIAFEIMAPNTDETPKKNETPKSLVHRLAQEKALSVAHSLGKLDLRPTLIIAADTIVVAPNGKKILGKPANHGEAKQMVRSLSGKTHTVLTGYCFCQIQPGSSKKPKLKTRVISTRVKIRKLTLAEVEEYIGVGESMDKAGAYAAQGTGMTLVESIQGSYTNVVGLPMAQVLADLQRLT